MNNDFDEVAICLRPLPASDWLTDDTTGWSSRVNLPMPAVLVKSVRLNGKSLDWLPSNASQIVVWPRVPRQGDRLEIRYTATLPNGVPKEGIACGRTGPAINERSRAGATPQGALRSPSEPTYGFTPRRDAPARDAHRPSHCVVRARV